jgi:hypothetical protein
MIQEPAVKRRHHNMILHRDHAKKSTWQIQDNVLRHALLLFHPKIERWLTGIVSFPFVLSALNLFSDRSSVFQTYFLVLSLYRCDCVKAKSCEVDLITIPRHIKTGAVPLMPWDTRPATLASSLNIQHNRFVYSPSNDWPKR